MWTQRNINVSNMLRKVVGCARREQGGLLLRIRLRNVCSSELLNESLEIVVSIEVTCRGFVYRLVATYCLAVFSQLPFHAIESVGRRLDELFLEPLKHVEDGLHVVRAF